VTPATSGRLPVSVAIVARDEEEDLPGAIASVPFASEVVVILDPRTRDGTREVARALDLPDRPVRVIEREWGGHVAQKNFALEACASPWVLSLDADERVSGDLGREIEALFRPEPAAAGYTVGRRTFYLGRWMRGGGWYPDRKLRLVRRGSARWGGTDPHDRLLVDGRTEDLAGDLLHGSYGTLSDHLRKADFFSAISARRKYERGARHPLLRLLVHPPARFARMFILRGGWRDGIPGAIAAGMGTLYVFLKYAKLWELIEAERRRPGSGGGGERLEA
jgi:glycosyltransferase involved in cell wall biosynthesis